MRVSDLGTFKLGFAKWFRVQRLQVGLRLEDQLFRTRLLWANTLAARSNIG